MSKLLGELKRRNVFKVAAAYLVVAWLLIQIVGEIAEPLGFPDWFSAAVIVLLATGFPVALILAWAFELTPEGVKKSLEVPVQTSITRDTGRKLDFIIIAVMALALVYFIWESRVAHTDQQEANPAQQPAPATAEAKTTPPDATGNKASIAVLPFNNLSGNPDTDYFVSGLHDDLLTQLSKLVGLKVISRTSVMQYANTQKNMREIGEELGVATLLEGGVQRAGNRIRLNVQLIAASNDEHLWAETYDRTLSTDNIFDIQAEITRRIATSLETSLSLREEKALAEVPTQNLEAYDAYLLAKNYLQMQMMQDGQDNGLPYALKAVELDPALREGWSLLAWSYLQKFWFYGRNPEDKALAKSYMEKAERLDPTAADVELNRGWYTYWVNYDYPKAIQHFKNTLASQPGNAWAYTGLGAAARRAGDWPLYLSTKVQALHKDPNLGVNWWELSSDLANLGQFEEAEKVINRMRSRHLDHYWILAARSGLDSEIGMGFSKTLETSRAALDQFSHPSQNARMVYVLNEATFGDPHKASDYLEKWNPEFVETQFSYMTRNLFKARLARIRGEKLLATELALKTLPSLDMTISDPANTARLVALGMAQALAGKKQQAIESAKQIVSIYPPEFDASGTANYHLEAIRILCLAGAVDEALAMTRKNLQLDSHTSLAFMRDHPDFAVMTKTEAFKQLKEPPPRYPLKADLTLP